MFSKYNSYKDIATYALTCLITHACNAIAVRIFRLVTAIKAKPRTKTQIKLLDALVGIRFRLLSNEICCEGFGCSANMIKLHNNVDPYDLSESSSINDNETEYLENIIHYLASIGIKM